MMKKTESKHGFTIVELALSSAFLGILLITIALLVTHIITIYQKGMTLKSVNTVGEDLIDNFTRTISATPRNGNEESLSSMYGELKTDVRLTNTNDKIQSVPSTGIFCTGQYTYIWNTGYVLDDKGETYQKSPGVPFTGQDRAKVSYQTVNNAGAVETKTIDDFRLLKVLDSGRRLCVGGPKKQYDLNAEPEELIEKSEDNLALYDLTIFTPTHHEETQHSFYSGTFILATIRGSVDIKAAGDFCKTEVTDDLNTDFAYCAMNKFNFAVRATGESYDDKLKSKEI